MKPYYQADGVTLYCGDCREVLPTLADVTAIVTDPPYGLSFMGKDWDEGVPGQYFWELALSACKPGAPLLAFGGTRTYHRLACAIEDAGWTLRDCLMWVYGSGFPKSLDISKAIDKAAGAEREVVNEKLKLQSYGTTKTGGVNSVYGGGPDKEGIQQLTAPATEAAKLWHGWGTSLKPAFEPILFSMKPVDGTFANNAMEHGVAGLNIDGCRVGTEVTVTHRNGNSGGDKFGRDERVGSWENPPGRFPANLIHDGSDEVVSLFPETGKSIGGGGMKSPVWTESTPDKMLKDYGDNVGFGDSGTAARMFYCAKASSSERGASNTHATVKPLELMSYLCKLVSMPKQTGTCLDMFAGSGTTMIAAQRWFEHVIGIEQDEEHCKIIVDRLKESGGLF